MRIQKVALSVLCVTLAFLSCKKDNNSNVVTVEIRDRGEQQIIDNDSIVGYLETHYYNKSAFEGNMDPNMSELEINAVTNDMTISSDADSLLINAVETKTATYADTEYEFYILKINQGGGDSPTFADQVRVSYEGTLLDETVFDNTANPVTFNLLSLVPGWSKAVPNFSTAESFADAGDGTIDYMNHGVGVMFLPSGLGYFSSPPSNIPLYSPLIFKFELFQMYQNDDDGDGVPSYMEDLNGDGDFTLADDDTDADNIPNFADTDDDGDGVLTANEIVVKTYNRTTKAEIEALVLDPKEVLIGIKEESDGTFTGTTVTFTDTDEDGIPDYLDAN